MTVGIREYWIISPQNGTVQVFSLNANGEYSEPIMYSKDDIIKSVIFEDLKIESKDIFE